MFCQHNLRPHLKATPEVGGDVAIPGDLETESEILLDRAGLSLRGRPGPNSRAHPRGQRSYARRAEGVGSLA